MAPEEGISYIGGHSKVSLKNEQGVATLVSSFTNKGISIKKAKMKDGAYHLITEEGIDVFLTETSEQYIPAKMIDCSFQGNPDLLDQKEQLYKQAIESIYHFKLTEQVETQSPYNKD